MSGVASEDQLPLASQCLALCQTLASQGKAFSFTVTLGSTFTFSMDAKESAAALPKRKKKSSPSTLRRNAARRVKFLNRKVEKASVVEVQCPPGISHTPVPFSAMEVERESFKCYHCGERFASNVSLMSHKRVSQQWCCMFKHQMFIAVHVANLVPPTKIWNSTKRLLILRLLLIPTSILFLRAGASIS